MVGDGYYCISELQKCHFIFYLLIESKYILILSYSYTEFRNTLKFALLLFFYPDQRNDIQLGGGCIKYFLVTP